MLIPKETYRIPQDNGEAPRRVAILGSTGSIGCSTLEIVRANPERFTVDTLVAQSSIDTLFKQISEFRPRHVVLRDEKSGDALRTKLIDTGFEGVSLEVGDRAIESAVASEEIDIVVAAIVGEAGLRPVLSALKADKVVALANKESLVSGGKLVHNVIQSGKGILLPVDSEHSALFQVLQGEEEKDIQALTLMGSGGPFLNLPISELASVTPERAVRHPKWNMGPKISVDSATMMNKALEVIEAYWLFGVEPEKIEVIIHPQHIIHSMVRFVDGSTKAQLAVPDMKGPIGYALSYPNGRILRLMDSLDLAKEGRLEFVPLDHKRFPAIGLARAVLSAGGGVPAVFNAANEVAVHRFLSGEIKFTDIVPLVAGCVERIGAVDYETIEDLEDLVRHTREMAQDNEREFLVGGIRA